ncbi:MAG: diguanylate cyclase [Tahibacter sp.]
MTIKRQLLVSHLLVVLLGAGALGAYLYLAAVSQVLGGVSERLLDNARLLAASIDRDDLDAMTVRSESGASSRVSGRLVRAVSLNTSLSSSFVADVQGTDVRVIASSDPTIGPSSNNPLLVDELALLRNGLHEAVVSDVREAARERGELSALAPIGGNDSRYVVGVRLLAPSLQSTLRLLRLSALVGFLAGVLLALVLSRLLAQRLQRRIIALGQRCRALAAGEIVTSGQAAIGDEFDRVIAEFDSMAQRLRESGAQREQALDALTESNQHLETRVEERTRAIEEATHQLKGEIENRLQVEALLAEAALTDALTGLLNRRAMLEMLVQALHSTRGEGGFSVILADIDHFKRINDDFGHNIGDEVLVAAARELERFQGDNRHASRWGGEEFFLLLPGVKLTDACRRAEELRERVARMGTPVAGLRVTISLGVAEVLPGEALEECLRRCDQALYRAKDAGRNTVVAARGAMFATMS